MTAATPVLARGAHHPLSGKACLMEVVSWLDGGEWTDRPTCTHPLLAEMARAVNDRTPSEALPDLAPMAFMLTDTPEPADGDVAHHVRALLLNWVARRALAYVPIQYRRIAQRVIQYHQNLYTVPSLDWRRQLSTTRVEFGMRIDALAGNRATDRRHPFIACDTVLTATMPDREGWPEFAIWYLVELTPSDRLLDLLGDFIGEYRRLTLLPATQGEAALAGTA